MKGAPHHPCYLAGYHDAQRGITACAWTGDCAVRWAEGYDFADENGEAPLPRFGKLTHRKRR